MAEDQNQKTPDIGEDSAPEAQATEKSVDESPRQAGTIPQAAGNRSKKDVAGDLENAMRMYNNALKISEKLKHLYVEKKVEHAYYRLWNGEANRQFHRVVVFKQRREAILAGKRV